MQASNAAILQSGNLFTYTMNNPVRWVDPSGMVAQSAGGGVSNLGSSAALAINKSAINALRQQIGSGVISTGQSVTLGASSGDGVRNSVVVGAIAAQVIDLGRGWTARIERGVYPNTQRHIHIMHNRHGSWSQNEDGSPHDRGGNSSGRPPNHPVRRLKELGKWDWDAKQDEWVRKIEIGGVSELGTVRVVFLDGREATFFPPPMLLGMMPNRSALVRMYLNLESPDSTTNQQNPQNQQNLPLQIPTPNPAPVPILPPFRFPVPIFRLPF